MLIGLTGKKRSGKDTVANYLIKKYNFTRYAFADPIKEIIISLLHKAYIEDIDYYVIHNKETPIPIFNVSYRTLAQTLGTEWGRKTIKESIWVDIAKEFLFNNKEKNTIISDIRFNNEAEIIKSNGGKIILIDSERTSYNDFHESESGIRSDYLDYIISNNDSFDKLFSQVDLIYNKLYG